MRIGQGFDVHPFAQGRKLVIGGVHIEYGRGLDGHSDADVLLHAICDALLGAAGLGDIGQHYPDTAAEFRNVDSRRLLRDVAKKLSQQKLRVVNIDATIIAQEPRMSPHMPRMIGNIAGIMYSPAYNRLEDRAELLAFMRHNNFPALVTGLGGSLHASHLPTMIHEAGDKIVIDMHMAHNNQQWHEFFDEEVLVIFTGPHGYVSPRWYEDTERVPTWNYTAVHAYGVPKIIEERAAKYASQRRLVEHMDPQWLPKFDALSEKYVTGMLNGIVNFQIPVNRIETRWKLSQNRGRGEMERIAAALVEAGDTALAKLHREHFPD